MPDLDSKPVRGVEIAEMPFEQLLDSEAAAALLKIHPKGPQKMARRGRMTAVQIGQLWRFRASALNEYLVSKIVAARR